VGGGVASFIARLVAKVLAYWKTIVQLRHSQETSGLYLVFPLLVTITIGIVAADGFEKVGEGEEDTVTKETVMKTTTN